MQCTEGEINGRALRNFCRFILNLHAALRDFCKALELERMIIVYVVDKNCGIECHDVCGWCETCMIAKIRTRAPKQSHIIQNTSPSSLIPLEHTTFRWNHHSVPAMTAQKEQN